MQKHDEMPQILSSVGQDHAWPLVSPAGPATDTTRELAQGCTSVPLLDYHCNISVEHAYLHMENPKVASTSTLRVLQYQENQALAAKMDNPHARDQSPLRRLSSFDEEQQNYFLNSPDIYRFAFVRNPFGRLLSAYLSKIAKPLLPKAEILAVLNGTSVDKVADLTQSVDFPTFVDVVCSQDLLSMNPHWNNQVMQLICDRVKYNKIGKFENLAEDFTEVCSRIFTGQPQALTQSANKTGAINKILEYYNEGLVNKVYQKYYEDFNAFEYPDSIAAMVKVA